MARITFCDGCDRKEEFPVLTQPKTITTVCVAISSHVATSDTLHLCAECETKLREIANPKAWRKPSLASSASAETGR